MSRKNIDEDGPLRRNDIRRWHRDAERRLECHATRNGDGDGLVALIAHPVCARDFALRNRPLVALELERGGLARGFHSNRQFSFPVSRGSNRCVVGFAIHLHHFRTVRRFGRSKGARRPPLAQNRVRVCAALACG